MFSPKEVVQYVRSQENIKRIKMDTGRYLVYNGQLKKFVEEAIRKEFLLPETVNDLIARIVPLNIVQKIVDKLSVVYMHGATRKSGNEDESDDKILETLVYDMEFDNKMKHANRFFKLHKHTALEPYLDRNGVPKTRALPSQSYTVMSNDLVEPEKPTAFIKHINFDSNKNNERHHYWTDSNFLILNGKGDVVGEEMAAIGNENGDNPFGVIPFTYVNSSQDILNPVMDDDLITMQIIINLLLSDLVFASKFQAWSLITIIGAESNVVKFNPNSIISLPEGAKIDTLKPEVDIPEMLAFIESLVALLLTSKNLSVGTVTGSPTAVGDASGVAKIIDRAETTEDRHDQISFFRQAEREYWFKLAHNIMPVWVKENKINQKYAVKFSEQFYLNINYPEPRVLLGEKERLDLEVTKLNMGLTTRERAIKKIEPDLEQNQIDEILLEIEEEQNVQAETFREQGGANDKSNEPTA